MAKLTSPARLLLLTWLVLALPSHAQNGADDPLETYNRGMFAFNDGVDRFVLRPTAVAYQWVMPGPLNKGVTNFFTTVADVPDSANALLQWKVEKSGISISRFFINLTLGFFGLFDVAKELGFPNQQEDFGQTLAVWGVPSGPYIVLPFLGGTTIRDGAGFIPDAYFSPLYVEDVPVRNSLAGLKLVDLRAEFIQMEKLVSGDKYIFLRDAYLQRRAFLISEGMVKDSFTENIEQDDGWLDDEF